MKTTSLLAALVLGLIDLPSTVLARQVPGNNNQLQARQGWGEGGWGGGWPWEGDDEDDQEDSEEPECEWTDHCIG